MIDKKRYRDDVEVAVNLFRPVLQHLKIREPDEQKTVYLADEKQLDFIVQVGNVCITVLLGELKNVSAVFLQRQTGIMTDCYIVINKNLYEGRLCDVKLAGVHEFCHFMALIYALTASSIDKQTSYFKQRLNNTLDKLSEDSFNNLFIALSNDLRLETIDELTNEHYYLGFENMSIDYIELMKNFLFSKELFEEYFNETERHNFLAMWKSDDKDTRTAAVRRYKEIIDEAASNKSINQNLAEHQAYKWAMDYLEE